MFRNKLFTMLKVACRVHRRTAVARVRQITPVTIGLITASCEEKQVDYQEVYDPDKLEHEFLIRQASTVNVNAATQLITVTLVAIQDTSERLRDALSKEICLVRQALEWGEDGTPPHHWDQLVAIRGSLCDLKHNLRTLFSYMDYAEKLATVAAEISYLSGNIAASDAICERIDHACRSCNAQKQLTHDVQQESLELQQQAIVAAPNLQDKLKHDNEPKIKNTKT
ncbi:putative 50S ribosomal protein L20 [Operophtera brumata]|uniref:Direct IAP-binding protein with low pI n=1 Tax=Operophtera brumata TaxID=104452 RepID=A0A0L7LLZ1_OPEBR|nr:putative 50S ribosomal protein L20 [Operophtera brumata]